jgi:hypothetical protein
VLRIELNFLVIYPDAKVFFIKHWEYLRTLCENRHIFKANIDQKSLTLKSE